MVEAEVEITGEEAEDRRVKVEGWRWIWYNYKNLRVGVKMLITLDIKNRSMMKDFLNYISTLEYIDIKTDISTVEGKISEKDRFKEFAGMWKNRDISVKNLRKKAWKK